MRSNILERLEVGLTSKLYETEAEQFTCGWLLYVSLFIVVIEVFLSGRGRAFGGTVWGTVWMISSTHRRVIESPRCAISPYYEYRHSSFGFPPLTLLVFFPTHFLVCFCFFVVGRCTPEALCLVWEVCALPLRAYQPSWFISKGTLLIGFWKYYSVDWVSISWFLFSRGINLATFLVLF